MSINVQTETLESLCKTEKTSSRTLFLGRTIFLFQTSTAHAKSFATPLKKSTACFRKFVTELRLSASPFIIPPSEKKNYGLMAPFEGVLFPTLFDEDDITTPLEKSLDFDSQNEEKAYIFDSIKKRLPHSAYVDTEEDLNSLEPFPDLFNDEK